ncbi:MAG: hypothetical protein K0Q55_2058 [Verrucomicrobia bacterium]|jgi:hypothetical protein|nr:hypothetical protein [Verrucomicrobiota bacterium]
MKSRNHARFFLFALMSVVFCASVRFQLLVAADAATAAIEKMPRPQRLDAYTKAANASGLSAADRQVFIQGLARHAKDVSPQYQNTPLPWNTATWMSLLRRGWEAAPTDAGIGLALARLHIDARQYSAALPIVTALDKVHPDNHEVNAFQVFCQTTKDGAAVAPPAGPLKVFPLHFVVLTKNPAAHRVATREQCRKECDILNATFRTREGKELARFVFKGFSSYDDIKDSASALIRSGDATAPFDTDAVARDFNACKDRKVRDPEAINVYVFDSYNPQAKFGDLTSHGKRNSNRPYVLLDWERLDNKVQNAEAHEMGHAFGLEHVGVPGAVGKTSSNIMTSASENFGSGGLRDLGFSEAQAAVILFHAQRTYERLGLGK